MTTQTDEDLSAESQDSENQYVTFRLASETFALPMQSVLEIMRYPDDPVHVPLTHECLLGIASLRGSVVPLLDLRRLLELEAAPINDASRVLVVDLASTQLGLVVDQVERVFEIPADRIEPASDLSSLNSTEVLAGVYQQEALEGQSGEVIQLLDLQQLVQQEFTRTLVESQSAASGLAAGRSSKETSSSEQKEEELTQLVSFLLGEQEFAFRLLDVQEIIRQSGRVSLLPNSPPQLLGLINLRNSTFPLLSMQALFGLSSKASKVTEKVCQAAEKGETLDQEDQPMLLVLRRNKEKVALAVDQVKEVVRLHEKQLEPVPEVLSRLSNMGDVEAVCRLDQGERLITLLQSDHLFNSARSLTSNLNLDAEGADASQIQEISAVDNQDAFSADEEDSNECQLVIFTLDKEAYGLSIEQVQEITRQPDSLYHVPRCPDFVDGMMNLRGLVLPVLDMRNRLGLERREKNERQRILVLKMDNLLTGFVVDAINEVRRVKLDQIEEAPHLSEQQQKLLGQVVRLEENGQIIQLINCDELISSTEQAQLQVVDDSEAVQEAAN